MSEKVTSSIYKAHLIQYGFILYYQLDGEVVCHMKSLNNNSVFKTLKSKELLLEKLASGQTGWLSGQGVRLVNLGSLVRIPLKSVAVQPSCLVWAGTLVALYKCEGLFVVL